MKRKITLLSKTVLLAGIAVCAAICLTYIIWNVTVFKDDVSSFTKNRLAVEAGKLFLICVSELILGAYLLDRIESQSS